MTAACECAPSCHTQGDPSLRSDCLRRADLHQRQACLHGLDGLFKDPVHLVVAHLHSRNASLSKALPKRKSECGCQPVTGTMAQCWALALLTTQHNKLSPALATLTALLRVLTSFCSFLTSSPSKSTLILSQAVLCQSLKVYITTPTCSQPAPPREPSCAQGRFVAAPAKRCNHCSRSRLTPVQAV